MQICPPYQGGQSRSFGTGGVFSKLSLFFLVLASWFLILIFYVSPIIRFTVFYGQQSLEGFIRVVEWWPHLLIYPFTHLLLLLFFGLVLGSAQKETPRSRLEPGGMFTQLVLVG
jgi:hypothetical protein